MTIQTIIKKFLLRFVSAVFGFFLIFQPVAAQVFYLNPSNTPQPTSGGLVAPTSASSPTVTSGVTNTPFPTNTPLPTPTTTALLSITPTGPVNIIPQQGKTGPYVDNATDTVVVKDDTKIYIGGIFSEVKLGTGEAVPRTRLARIDLPLQTVEEWNPSPNARVETIAIDDATVYVGGLFTEVDTQPRNYIASFDKQTLAITTFRPDANDQVNALHVDANRLWVGGRFTAIAGENRLRLVSFSKPNFTLDAVNMDANAEIYTMAGNETTLFVGGAFTEIGGMQRNYIAAIDKATGKVTNWNPQLNNEVRSISVADNRVIVNGPFTNVNNTEVTNYSATIDPVTGEVIGVTQLNAQGTPVPGTTTTLTIKVDMTALGFQIPNLAEVLTFIIRAFFVIAGLIALFYLLLGALEWITSGGDEEKVASSRKKIVAAIVGVILIVVVLSIVITLEQIVFRGRLCVGLSCAATIPSLVKPLDENGQPVQ